MTPQQRAAAERLAKYWSADDWPGGLSGKKMDETAAILRELAAEPVQEPGIEYKRGYEAALNDCIKNGGEAWARSMFANNAEHIKPVQAPLLWYRDIGAGPMLCNPDRQDAHPLYAAPQQPMRCPTDGGECGAGGYCRPEPQQRKPLSDEQVRQIVVDASTSWAFKRDGSTSMRIARAIERAHGIGEPT